MKPVILREMNEKEYVDWYPHGVEEYAKDLIKNGAQSEIAAAREYSEKQMSEMLKDGLRTKDNHLFVVLDKNSKERVGIFWISYRQMGEQKQCFIADFEIEEQYRRQGYGRATMLTCEEVAKKAGAAVIRLHVFGFNHSAQALYTDLGYRSTNIQMEKVLD